MAEEGTHEELLATEGGVYAGLVKRQLDIPESSGSNNSNSSNNGNANGRVVAGGKIK